RRRLEHGALHNGVRDDRRRAVARSSGRASVGTWMTASSPYRVLLTRGMKGCYVYFTDDATRRSSRARSRHSRRITRGKHGQNRGSSLEITPNLLWRCLFSRRIHYRLGNRAQSLGPYWWSGGVCGTSCRLEVGENRCPLCKEIAVPNQSAQ